MLKILLSLGCLVCLLPAWAQEGEQSTKQQSSCSCRFATINQVGVMEGELGAAPLLQSINGVRYKTWFAGIGIGLDVYRYRGIPLFLDIRKNLLAKKNAPFLFADGGIHFAWPASSDKRSGYENKFSNGPYIDAGIGYTVDIGKGNSFLLSAGYSYKSVRHVLTSPGYCGMGSCPDYVETYYYTMNRISIKAGFEF